MKSIRRRVAYPLSLLLSVSLGLGWAACSSGDPNEATFPLDASSDLLSGFSFDSGLKPASGPVQLSLALSGQGKATVHTVGLAVSGDDDPVLHQVGEGTVAIDGGFVLDGRLVIDVPNVTKYDGDIPGLDDVRIAIVGESKLVAFGIDAPATALAPIPETALPPIPLPGGVPGTLNLRVAAGSSLTVAVNGTCAGIDGDAATYRATGVRSGTLVLGAEVAIQVPVLGEKKFDVGEISVPIPAADVTFEAKSTIGEVVDPIEGSVASPKACSGGSNGAGGAGGTAASTGATSGSATTGTDATTSASTSVSQASVTSSGTSMGSCDAIADCGACQECELSEGGSCNFAWQACEDNPSCFLLLDCANACPSDDPGTAIDELATCLCGDPGTGATCDEPAAGSCYATYAEATSTYRAVIECLSAEPCIVNSCF